MTHRHPIRGLAAVCLLGAAIAGSEERRASARVYTNEDLARVSVRDATAAVPEPAATPAAASLATTSDNRRESFWRAEAERVRRRLEPWRDEVAILRHDIPLRQAEPGVRPYTDPKVRAMQRKLDALEARIREAEDRLEESARRAGAMPGWLR